MAAMHVMSEHKNRAVSPYDFAYSGIVVPIMAETPRQLHARIYGRVQLVMFRDFVTRTARPLSLTGLVRNLKDGSVEVIAEGEPAELTILLKALHKGSMLSKVEHVEYVEKIATVMYNDFKIDYGN